jgi:hypothetical protein
MELIFEDISQKIYKNSKDGMIYTMLNMSVYVGNKNRNLELPEDWRLVRVEKDGNERDKRYMEAALDDSGGIFAYSIKNGKMERNISIENGFVARDSLTDLEARESFIAYDIYKSYESLNSIPKRITLEEYLKSSPVFISESEVSVDENSVDFDMIGNAHIVYLFEKEKELKGTTLAKNI